LKAFLLDENVPRRIRFTPSLPVVHSGDFGVSCSDTFLWDTARANSYVIVTKDSDFSDRIMLAEPPPWIVHLRIGNMRKLEFHTFLAKIWPQVEALLPTHKLINVYASQIEAAG